MVAYLRGPALACVQPLLSQEPRVAELSSVGAFTAYLRASFGDPDERGTAKRQLRELRQDKDAASYFARIRELATIAGYTDQVAIVDIAVAGLRANLKDELAKRGDFDTLAKLVGFVVPLDNRLRRRSEERKKEETHSPPSQTYAGTLAKSRLDGRLDPKQPEPRPSLLPPRQQPAFVAARQDLRRDSPRPTEPSPQEGRRPYGPLSEAEKDRRRRAGTCIICDKPGHFASDCPSRSNKPREPVIAKPEAPKA